MNHREATATFITRLNKCKLFYDLFTKEADM